MYGLIILLFTLFSPLVLLAQHYHTNDAIADSLFHLSAQYLYNSQLREAINEAENIIICCPQNYGRSADARMVLTSAWKQAGDFNEAKNQLDSAVSILEHYFEKPDHRSINVLIEEISLLLLQYKTYEALHVLAKLEKAKLLYEPEPNQVLRILELRGSIAYQQEEWDTALSYFRQLLAEIAIPDSFNDSIQVFNSINLIGNVFFYRGQYFAALEKYREALDFSKAIYGVHSIPAAQSWFNIGLIYSILGYYTDAEKMYNQALELRKKLQGENHFSISEIYKEFAINYQEQKDYEQALTYYLKALEIRERFGFSDDPVLLNLYIETATTFMHTGKTGMSIEYISKAEALLDKSFGGFQIASFHRSVADIYLETEDNELAIKHLNESLKYFISSGDNKLILADIYLQLGRAYLAKMLDAQALTYFKRAAALSESLGEYQPVFLESSVNLISLFVRQGNHIAAIEHCEHIFSRYDVYRDSIIPENIPYPEYLLDALINRIAIERYLEDNDDHIIQLITLGKEVVNRFRNQSVYDATQLFWLSKARSFYESVFVHAYNRYCNTHDQIWLDMAFEVAEAARSIRLLNHLKARGLHQHFGIPETLFRKEQDFKYRLQEANRLFYEQAGAGELSMHESLQKTAIQKHQITDSLRNVQSQIKSEFPEYYNLVYGQSNSEFSEVIKKLKAGTAMLNFFSAGGNMYAFAIGDGYNQLELLGNDKMLRSEILDLRENLMTLGNTAHATKRLSGFLIEPFSEMLGDAQRLVIIPDDLLFYLPFDLLSLPDPEGSGLVFLGSVMTISYHQSATLWGMFQIETPPAKPLLAAFAPWFDKQSTPGSRDINDNFLPPLKYALEESSFAAGLFKGNVYREAKAGKAAFLESLGRYNIIHIATHASFNDQEPEFSKMIFRCMNDSVYCIDPVFAYDIFHLQTNARLVVLSACNTGIGRINRGDGISSLATAFQYAGAKNVVLSLWPVPDLSTSIFMEYFYKSLHGGNSIENALQQAKLSLASHNLAFEHPIHWAGFQVYGASHFSFKVDSLRWYQKSHWQVIFSFGIFALCGFWFFLRYSSKDKQK